MTTVSRDVIRAVLEVRDRRHGETHAALLAIYQALIAELVDAGVIDPGRLAERIESARKDVSADVHGETGRSIVAHTLKRLEEPTLPRWQPHAHDSEEPG